MFITLFRAIMIFNLLLYYFNGGTLRYRFGGLIFGGAYT